MLWLARNQRRNGSWSLAGPYSGAVLEEFDNSTAATAMAATRAGAAESGCPPVCVFSKHLQFLDYKELAETCNRLGLDGVDLTVRRGGHVLPENVDRDLPRAVEAIRSEGLEVPMITTRLKDGDDPDARTILKAASKQGIRYFRVGGQKYEAKGNPLEQLPRFTAELRRLAAVAEEFDMVAGYHNHSGMNNVGAAIWDLHKMFTVIGSDHIGSNFDIGHAKIEGGYGAWQVNARLIAPFVKMMAVKDFVWFRDHPHWVPLGKGIAPVVDCLRIFREQADFAGPVSIHFEYDTDSRDELLEHIASAVKTVRENLKKAGYPA